MDARRALSKPERYVCESIPTVPRVAKGWRGGIQVLRNRVFRLTGWRTLAPISQRILGTVFRGLPLEQRSDPARRNLQHRKARAARAEPGGGADRHAPAGFSPLARRAPAQQRESVAGRLSL